MTRREFLTELIESKLATYSYKASTECIDEMVEDIMYFFHMGTDK
jgi:tetrahydromethanopterin S-methyltransferase subunit F